MDIKKKVPVGAEGVSELPKLQQQGTNVKGSAPIFRFTPLLKWLNDNISELNETIQRANIEKDLCIELSRSLIKFRDSLENNSEQ